jgi:predicted nuclease of restriction endonuclease-like (RecB) superfamily
MNLEDNSKVKMIQDVDIIDESELLEQVIFIIEKRKYKAQVAANSEVTMMFWEVGQYVNSVILKAKRAAYGKQIVATLSQQLVEKYGNTYEITNLRRMMRFAENFKDSSIVATLSPQLSWSHIVELLPLKSDEARIYYAQCIVERRLGVRELRKQIAGKAFERREIADLQLSKDSKVPFNIFKDPYLLDVLDLKENYLEADLQKAIIRDIEAFILEFGHGFAFVESQKRMPIGEEVAILDLLFYNRILKRLVAVELKIGSFEASYKGQMELYLAWLDQYERQDGECPPVGIILCAAANREKVDMLKMDKAGIAVAEYWTELPPKEEFEKKIISIMEEAKERLERRKSLPLSNKMQLELFYDEKDENYI